MLRSCTACSPGTRRKDYDELFTVFHLFGTSGATNCAVNILTKASESVKRTVMRL